MYNYMRRCLMKTVKDHKKVFTQVICNNTAAFSSVHCINASQLCIDTTHKRFYCQAAVQNANIPTDSNSKDIDAEQVKLDEFISDPKNKKLLQILELEVDVMRHNAEQVPEHMKARHWLELLSLTTRSQRKKYLRYLFINEKAREKRKVKLEEVKSEWKVKLKEEKEKPIDPNEMRYGLSYNSMFLRIYPKTINHFYHSRLISAMLYESKIVFDCSYEDYMTNIENHNCAKQLTFAFAANRIHDNPMFLHFCNLNEKGSLRRNFHRNMPNLLDEDFPAVVTSESYLDLFPKDQLLYLTPHCRTDLVEYDPDTVYIIGAMVDKSQPKPISFAKAKKEGLRMAKLPIEKYLDWGSGSTKNFTVNQVLSIMLDLRHTKCWKQAFQHVPIRKLREAREYMLQRKLENEIMLSQKNSENKKEQYEARTINPVPIQINYTPIKKTYTTIKKTRVPTHSSVESNFLFDTRKKK